MSTISPCETLISPPFLDGPSSPINKLFDSSPDADIILLSSECHEFRVPKLYIINSSPVLEKLIRTSSNPCEMASPVGSEASPATIQLNESYTILSSLFTFIFPVSPALPPTIEQTLELLSVAQKYEMDTDPPFIHPENAFYVYSLAQKYRLRDEALQAARMTLNITMTIEDLEDKLDVMPGSFLHELWKYHQRVRGSLMLDLIEFRRSGARGTLKDLECKKLSSFGYPSWLDDYIVSIAKSPAAFDLTRFHMALTRHSALGGFSSGCSDCASIPIETIQLLWTALTAVVNKSLKGAGAGLSLVEEEPHTQDIEPTRETSPPPEDFNMRNTDVILRSSDGASFRVHRLVLTTASPFFDDLFSLPQPDEDETIDGIHVVRLSEDKEVLHSLITMLYPIPSVLPDSYIKVLDLLIASQKYDMAAVQSSIRAEVSRKSYPSLSGAEAFHMYAIARSKGLIPEMENFARLTLDHPMTFESIGDELGMFNGWALRELAHFRKRCRDSLVLCLESFLDYRGGPSKIWTCCFPSRLLNSQLEAPDQGLLARWLRDLISQTIKELKQSYTRPLLKQHNFRKQCMVALQQHITETNCPFCARVHIMEGDAFWGQVKNKLTTARDKVS
ncbi:hypothetical protein BJY52DRAFT_1301738 [Lactarius psammicola]|nr:hypothetical protein BJY52DRAFT_1301738 [Lactarius psammicola]